MKNSNKQSVIKGLSVVSSIIATIAAMIAIYQFTSGHSSLFPGKPTMNAPSTSAPMPSPTSIITPGIDTPSESTPSTNHINYTFLTWECWIGIGLLVGALAGGVAGYKGAEDEFSGCAAGFGLGIGSGVMVAVLVGFLSSTIINYLNIEYAFIWDVSITTFVVLCSSLFLGYVIGAET